MELWVKPDALDLTGTPGELLMETGGTGTGMNISLVDRSATEIDVVVVVQDADAATDHLEVFSTTPITDISDFSHIAVTFDPGTGTATLYTNGAANGTGTLAAVTDWSGTGDFSLGGPGFDLGGAGPNAGGTDQSDLLSAWVHHHSHFRTMLSHLLQGLDRQGGVVHCVERFDAIRLP